MIEALGIALPLGVIIGGFCYTHGTGRGFRQVVRSSSNLKGRGSG